MKKNFKLLIILLLASLGLVAVGSVSLAHSANQVTVDEINSFGDKSAAEGIQLAISVGSFEDRLNWNTQVVFGESVEVKSDRYFYQLAQDARWRLDADDPVSISVAIEGNDRQDRESYKQDKQFLAAWGNLQEVYNAVAAGPLEIYAINKSYITEKRVCLNDYYEYYPLFIEGTVYRKNALFGQIQKLPMWMLDLANKEYEEFTSFKKLGYWVGQEDADDPVSNLCSGIKYRMWPEYPQMAYISVVVDQKNRERLEYSFEMLADAEFRANGKTSMNIPMETYSVSEATGTDIYYAIDLRLKGGGRPSAETFESGYGVWRIGYQIITKSGDPTLELTENAPELIYEIDPVEMLLDIVVSEDGEEMFVFTAKDGMYLLTVIDLQTKQVVQKLELMDYNPETTPEIRYVFHGENVVVPMFDEKKMVVIAVDETERYETQFVIDREADRKNPAVLYLEKTYREIATHWRREPVSVEVAWKDGKLAMVYSLTNSYGNNAGGWESQRPACFWLAVYDETGVVYAADFQMSQGVTEYSNAFDRDDICEIRDDVAIGISWGE